MFLKKDPNSDLLVGPRRVLGVGLAYHEEMAEEKRMRDCRLYRYQSMTDSMGQPNPGFGHSLYHARAATTRT